MGNAPALRTLDWHVPPPPSQPKGIEIVWPSPGRPVKGWIVTPAMLGIFTHYTDRRTLPCIGRENGCEFCGPYSSRRWLGYLGIYDRKESRLGVAQISKEAARTNETLATPGVNLRGLFLRLSRVGDRKNAPCRAELEIAADVPELPAPFNLQELLCAVWGFHPQAAGFEVPPSVRKGV